MLDKFLETYVTVIPVGAKVPSTPSNTPIILC